MANPVKTLIKGTFPVQYLLRKRYLPISVQRYESMPPEEKTPLRLVWRGSDKVRQICSMLDRIRIVTRPGRRFQVWIDTGLSFPAFFSMTDNIPPDYSLVIDHSIRELKQKYAVTENEVSRNNHRILCAVEKYLKRIEAQCNTSDPSLARAGQYYSRMITEKAESLEEALQRILFWSSLFWQSRHRLVGLGRLDVLLDRFADEDEEKATAMIMDFYDELHRYYAYKSNYVSLGDTGQIIILGGKDPEGRYFENALTRIFIRAMIKKRLPDPKLFLRICLDTPDDLIREALECIATGIGCPVLSNDEVVEPALEAFGYSHADACNYVTSACWEPVAYGRSLEKNNIVDINYAQALSRMAGMPGFTECKSFEEVLSLYLKCLDDELEKIRAHLNGIEWEPDPLMTLFTDGCARSGRDIAHGGAVYSDYGILGVGLSNAVDSLQIVRELVFEKQEITLSQLKNAVLSNYASDPALGARLRQMHWFGKDEEPVITLTRRILQQVDERLESYRNRFGGRLKWGMSSPNYIEYAKNTGATLDGRAAGAPLGVHISCADPIPFTELTAFAGKMDYSGNRSNGNVVDFFVSPGLIRSNIDKFVLFIKAAVLMGFFEMQMNVVDSKTLIAAKKNPADYPDLIVRVWGFSAYFADLPEDYQDLLIERALRSEGAAF